MILGYLCNYSEGEVKRATRLGFQCLEVHARSLVPDLDNPKGLDKIAGGVNGALHANNISISAISHYDTNILTYPVKKAVKRYRGVFELAKKLGVGVIPSMAGNLPDAPYAEGMKAFARSFREIAKLADDMGMKIAFENWPGIGGDLPWKPKNLAWNPRQWAAMFDAVPSKALGLEFDPSHLVWQGIDYMGALRMFKDRVYHSHAKDTEVIEENVRREGLFGVYHGCWRYRIPGYGVVNWAEYIAGLIEIGYDDGLAIEHEDDVFSGPRWEEGLIRGYHVLNPLINPN